MNFRSSALSRVMHCPGSWLKEQGRPRIIPSSGHEEGTVVHDLAAQCLQYNQDPSVALNKEWRTDGIDPMIITQDMVDAATVYVDHCRGLYGADGGQGGVEIPGRLEFDGGVVLTGTRDHWWTNGTELHVSDLKYGFGWVYPEDNWQLISYAIMAWQQEMQGNLPLSVHLHIIQPRAYGRHGGPVYSWQFHGDLLRNYLNQISNTLTRAALPDAELVSGKHCRYCKYLLECDVAAQASGNAVDVSGLSTDHELTPNDVAMQLSEAQDAMERLKHRITALEAHGVTLSQQGQAVPGYEVRATWSRGMTWDVPDPVTAGDEMGVDLRAPAEPLTPAQAVKAGLITEEMVGFMASKKKTGHALKRVNMDAIRRRCKHG